MTTGSSLLPSPSAHNGLSVMVAPPLRQRQGRGAIPAQSQRSEIRPAHEAEGLPEWPRSAVARASRAFLQAPLFAALDLLAPAKVAGLEELAAVQGPVLLAANHTSHLDTPVLLKALPPERRGRVAVAAASDYFFTKPWLGAAVALAFNAFPFERTSCSQVRSALERCRAHVDEGWSVLLYPEGTRSITGSMAPFKPGLGLLAVEMGVPVVPVYLGGPFSILPKGRSLPRKGSITVRFGKPLNFSSACHFRDAAHAIEEAVRSLATGPVQGGARMPGHAAIRHGSPLKDNLQVKNSNERVA